MALIRLGATLTFMVSFFLTLFALAIARQGLFATGFDPELLAMIPRPCVAIIFLFPLTEKYLEFKEEEEARLTKLEQNVSPDVVFFKQTIDNACGMIALLHSLANNESIVGRFY